jgi:hypothetical protein
VVLTVLYVTWKLIDLEAHVNVHSFVQYLCNRVAWHQCSTKVAERLRLIQTLIATKKKEINGAQRVEDLWTKDADLPDPAAKARDMAEEVSRL